MTVQTTTEVKPASRAAGMIVSPFGSTQFISRPLSTRQLEELEFGTTDGTYTVTIDTVEVANFVASTSTATEIRDGVLSDLLAAGIVAEAVSTDKLIIEAPSDLADAGFVITIPVITDYVKTQLVAHAQEVAFGLGLVRDDRAPGTERRVRLPRLATDVTSGGFQGIAAQDTMREPNASGWPHLSLPKTMRKGHIYVIAEGSGVEGAPLFVRHASGGGGSQLGAFRNDGDTSTAVAVPGLSSREDWSAAGIIEAEYFPQT